MVVKGVDVLLYANTGTDQTPVYKKVGGQKGATLTEDVDTIETHSKLSGGAKMYDYGYSGWSIKCDGLWLNEDDEGFDAYQALVDAMHNKQKIKVQVWESATVFFTGTALITSRELDGPDDDAGTYALELLGDGAPTYGVPP